MLNIENIQVICFKKSKLLKFEEIWRFSDIRDIINHAQGKEKKIHYLLS